MAIPFYGGPAVFNLDLGFNDLARVCIEDSYAGHRLCDFHQAFIYSEWSNGGRDVAAIATIINQGRIYANLAKCIININVRAAARSDNRGFARGRIRSTEAVYLTRIWATEGGKKNGIPMSSFIRQVSLMKKQTFAGTTPHDDARYFYLLTH
jgi:hypothetical protein